jgi:transposase
MEAIADVVADVVAAIAETPAPIGRPTDYKPEYVEQVAKLCELGATDEEIGDFFQVSTRTIYRWKNEYPEFCQALKIGKDAADQRVERSLFQKATGYYVVEQESHKLKIDQHKEEIEVVDVEKYVQPDTTAGIFWLKNRKSAEWRDKKEVEVTVSHEDRLGKVRERMNGRRPEQRVTH